MLLIVLVLTLSVSPPNSVELVSRSFCGNTSERHCEKTCFDFKAERFGSNESAYLICLCVARAQVYLRVCIALF